MIPAELLEIVTAGENSFVEFKRDGIHPAQLAAEITALLNHEGGRVLLGVEDDGTVSGLTREPRRVEEWVMQAARDLIEPAVIPSWQTVTMPSGVVGIVSVPANAPGKPYRARQGGHWVTKVRVGSTTRDAAREEEERLFQQSGGLRYGLKPVLGTTRVHLDHRRLHDYFTRICGIDDPPLRDSEDLAVLLRNLEFTVDVSGQTYATVDGMLLFGSDAGRYVPQSGIRAICYPGIEADYATRADEIIRGPLTPWAGADGTIYEGGLVDRAVDFVRRLTSVTARLEGGRRVDRWDYPEPAVREILVNALAHRDYSIVGTDVMLAIFEDRLEVISPGRLSNSVSVESMKSGARYARNQTLVNVLRDYGYVDARGMGIHRKVLPSMRAHNGTEPEFVEEEHRLIARLRK